MRRYVAAAGLFVLAASAAAQNSSSVDQSVVVPAQKQAPLERKLISPQEFYQYQGAYALSNGQTLTLTRGAVRLYAQVDQQPRQEILWHGDGQFSSVNGAMSMQIVWQDEDTVTGALNFQPQIAGAQPVAIFIARAIVK